jgi:DNA invertase Pin-like site-specific DNA recombinase
MAATEVVTPGTTYGYIRVSSKDQEDNGQSLLDQERRVGEYVEKTLMPKGYSGFRLFREGGVSAYTRPMEKRPQGRILLSQVRPGDCVVIPKLDRAFRSSLDGQQVLAFLKKQRVKVILLDYEGTTIDFDTTYGKLMLNTMLGFGEFESGMKSDRIKATFDHCKKTRGFANHPPPGYRLIRSNGKKICIPDPEQIAACEAIVRSYWTEGLRPTLNKLQNREIVLLTKYATGKPRQAVPIFEPNGVTGGQQWYKIWGRAIAALWNSERLDGLCREFGKNVSDLCDPEKGTVILTHGKTSHLTYRFVRKKDLRNG